MAWRKIEITGAHQKPVIAGPFLKEAHHLQRRGKKRLRRLSPKQIDELDEQARDLERDLKIGS